MAKICFLLLCHKNPLQIAEQAKLLTSAGDYIAIHFDARAKQTDYQLLKSELGDNPNVCFASRVKCGWGEWSLVQGSLNALREGYKKFPDATHFYMVSGDCMPIKPISYMRQYLDTRPMDYIEHHDFFESDWIKVGFKEERLIYRHWFNERNNKQLFYMTATIQKLMGLERDLPEGLQIMIGSQWWCLRRSTITKLLDLIKDRPDIVRFFKTTWIPDETFFQTLALHVVPRNEVESRTLTFLSFSDYGIPTVFYSDHLDFLKSQNHLFARKISENATDLRKELADTFASDEPVEIGPNGRQLINYLTSRGRTGDRFTERFWERGSRIGRQNTLQIILCKKWHVGKRFAAQFSNIIDTKNLGYVFDEPGDNMPDLGQLEHSEQKRNRHRRAVLKLLFERMDVNRLFICMDPSNLDTLRDFAGDRCELRILDVECIFSDDYLLGHAQRIGLADHRATVENTGALIATLRNNIRVDHIELQEMGLPLLFEISESAPTDTNAVALAGFLKIPQHRAEDIAKNLLFD